MSADPDLRRPVLTLRAGYAEREVSTIMSVALPICD